MAEAMSAEQRAEQLQPRSLADVLKRARLTQGESQKTSALKIGVSQASYARWEIGDGMPSVKQLPRIARWMGVPIADLVDVLLLLEDDD